MNDDHGESVMAMARRLILKADSSSPSLLEPGFKISDAMMKRVTLRECRIRVVACRGDLCQVHEVAWTFVPPLRSGSELRSRLTAIHHEVCDARVAWLVEKPVAIAILAAMAFLSYCILGLGRAELRAAVAQDDTLNRIVSALFGSPKIFSVLVYASFCFGHAAHLAEALYGLYHCIRTLKLRWGSTVKWSLLIALTGYPVLTEFQPLVEAARRHKKQS
jgi:hypothetical protein